MTIKKIMNSVESSLDDAGTEYTSEISKYPNKVLFLTTTDENNNVGILAIGTVKYGSTTAFIQCYLTYRYEQTRSHSNDLQNFWNGINSISKYTKKSSREGFFCNMILNYFSINAGL